MSRILISSLPGELRMARLEAGRLTDLRIERDGNPSRLGNIYRARIRKLDRGLGAAFCDIGEERDAFLSLAKGSALSEGDSVTLRVLRDAVEDKGPKTVLQDPSLLPPGLAEQAGPCLLLRGGDPVLTLLEMTGTPEEILVEEPSFHQRLKRLLAARRPDLLEVLRVYRGGVPLFEAEGLEAEIDALLLPEVPLSAGARLWVETTRACVAIDLDSGGRKDIRVVNLEAAKEIARQLRLRSLAGLIVVDFLELHQKAARQALQRTLVEAFADDPEPVQIQTLRPSGLLEMTRRRSRPSLQELLTAPCGTAGSGRRPNAVSVAFRALRELQAEALANPGAAPGLRVAPEVKQALEGEAAAALEAVARRIGYGPAVLSDETLASFEVTREEGR